LVKLFLGGMCEKATKRTNLECSPSGEPSAPQILLLLVNVIPDEQDKGILFLGLPVKTLDKVEIRLLYLNGFTSWFLE
jgi:hypothetical protein